MYSKLTPESAQKEKSEFLVTACNGCRPESGAYVVAKNELTFRASRRVARLKFGYTVLGIVIGVIAMLVKQWVGG